VTILFCYKAKLFPASVSFSCFGLVLLGHAREMLDDMCSKGAVIRFVAGDSQLCS
jgi:hypothetical protein